MNDNEIRKTLEKFLSEKNNPNVNIFDNMVIAKLNIDHDKSTGPYYLKDYTDKELSYENKKLESCEITESIKKEMKKYAEQISVEDDIKLTSNKYELAKKMYNIVQNCHSMFELLDVLSKKKCDAKDYYK